MFDNLLSASVVCNFLLIAKPTGWLVGMTFISEELCILISCCSRDWLSYKKEFVLLGQIWFLLSVLMHDWLAVNCNEYLCRSVEFFCCRDMHFSVL